MATRKPAWPHWSHRRIWSPAEISQISCLPPRVGNRLPVSPSLWHVKFLKLKIWGEKKKSLPLSSPPPPLVPFWPCSNLTFPFNVTCVFFFYSANVSQSTLDKPVFRSVMLAGNCTAWSTEFSLMGVCLPTKLLGDRMIPSTRSSRNAVQESTSLVLSLSIWSQLWLTRFAPVHTVHFSIPNNWSLARKTPPTITPEAITPSARKLLTWCWTESVSFRINAAACKDFWSFTHSVVVLDLDSLLCLWNVSLLILERNRSSSLRSTQVIIFYII